MRNYEQKISELGLEKGKLSKNLNQEVKEFEQAEREFESLNDQLQGMEESDENYESVSNEVEEYAQLLESTDADLVNKIQKYFDKKDYYAAKMEHMKNKTAEKKAGVPASSQSPTYSPKPAPQPAPAPAAQPAAAASAVVVDPQPAPEKKKDSGGSWLLWGGLAVLGLLVGVNVMRNREE